MSGAVDAARELLGPAGFADGEVMRGSERSEVRRIHVRRDGEPDSSVIVKTYVGVGESWAREAAALAALPGAAPVPALLASRGRPPVVVMSDCGSGPSVANALLGDDPARASDAVASWAGAIAELHGHSQGIRAGFAAGLVERAGDLPIAQETMRIAFDDAARILADQCASLGVEMRSAAVDELRSLPSRLDRQGCSALSPDDACPDNNVLLDGRLFLIDFEGAQWRPVAWDLAYLSVPWPSCWCAWRIPAEVASRAMEVYRSALAATLPYVATAEFDRDVAAAAVGWALVSSSWFLPNALGDDPPPDDPAKVTPARRAMILHRLGAAAENTELPALGSLAAGLRSALVRIWGEVALEFAPAFRAT